MFYAQLDINNQCIGVSSLSGIVPEMNNDDKGNFVSRMIQTQTYDVSLIGATYNTDGTWTPAQPIL